MLSDVMANRLKDWFKYMYSSTRSWEDQYCGPVFFLLFYTFNSYAYRKFTKSVIHIPILVLRLILRDIH